MVHQWKFDPNLQEGVDVRTYGWFCQNPIFWMHRQPDFLTQGAPLRARELRF